MTAKSDNQAGRVALYAADWVTGRVADVIVDRATKRVVRTIKARTIDRFRRGRRAPAMPAVATVLPSQNCTWLKRPVLGTGLTHAGAIATFAAGPVFWLVADLVWTALPA